MILAASKDSEVMYEGNGLVWSGYLDASCICTFVTVLGQFSNPLHTKNVCECDGMFLKWFVRHGHGTVQRGLVDGCHA